MSAKSSIEWTGSTWTPIRARVKENAAEIATAKGYTSLVQIATTMAGHVGPHCERCSPGCDHCYSETNNSRCLPSNGTGLPFDRRARDLVDVFVDERILTEPLRWRAPRKVFVCSQTDLFAEFVADEFIDRAFAVMALCPQHTFQVLTKRAERMRAYITSRGPRGDKHGIGSAMFALKPAVFEDGYETTISWPLSNVWLGTSVEDQQRANERYEPMKALAEQGWITWVSYEPALEYVNWWGWGFLRWGVIGAESGPGARRYWTKWQRGTIKQFHTAGVPLFCKQVGPRPICDTEDEWPEGARFDAREIPLAGKPFAMCAVMKDRKGGDMEEWPRDLRVREYPAVSHV